jgi:RND superfamily putative drug exporter
MVNADLLTLLPSSGSLTKTFIVQNEAIRQLTIVIGGMDNTFAQASLCLASWAARSSDPASLNTYVSAAATIAFQVKPIPNFGWDTIRIIGHSYGGAVITAAALIMVTVFGSFVFGDNSIVKLFGLGLAAAILIDATVVRLVLVPATMELLGDRNWWFPRFLDRIPRLLVEPIDDVDDELAELIDHQPTMR